MGNRSTTTAIAALAFGLAFGTGTTGHAATWSLIGGMASDGLVASPSVGRGLVCSRPHGQCRIFDLASGAWTPTSAVEGLDRSSSWVRLRNGDVLVVGAGPRAAITIRNAASGTWTRFSLPQLLEDPEVEQLDDGRILLSGYDQASGAIRVFTADEGLGSWTRRADSPDLRKGSWLLHAATLLSVGEKTWRYQVELNRWKEIGPAGAFLPWGGDVVLLQKRDGGIVASPTSAAGTDTSPVIFADIDHISRSTVVAAPLDAPMATSLLLVTSDRRTTLWRRGQRPIPLPWNPMGAPYELAALDAEHYIGVGEGGTIQLLSLDDRPLAGRPCDALLDYLGHVFDDTLPADKFSARFRGAGSMSAHWFASLVTPACRDDVRGGRAAALSTLTRSLRQSSEAGLVTKGRLFACATQDPSVLAEVEAWMGDSSHIDARYICADALATWPGADRVRDAAIARTLRQTKDGWEIDFTMVPEAYVPGRVDLREALVPILVAANKRRAAGYDVLRSRVCFDDGAMSSQRRQVCATMPRDAEPIWRQKRESRRRMPQAMMVTAVVGAAIGGSYLAGRSRLGLGIATGSGVLGGGTLGLIIPVMAIFNSASGEEHLFPAVFGGAILGGILGGIAGYKLASSTGAPAPVTAGGLALPYLITLAITFN